MSNPLKLYLKDIKKIPLLTADEEIELANRIKQGDHKAKDKMIKANLRLVINFAKRYRHFGIPFMDLIEEGNMGLIKAVAKFNPKKGFRFSTYASWWVRQYINRALANQGKIVRLPVYMVEIILRYKKVSEDLAYRMGRKPTQIEIAKKMKIRVDKLNKIDSLATRITSLEAPIGEDHTGQLGDLIEDDAAISPDKKLSEFMAAEKIKELLSKLGKDREKEILQLRYGLRDEDLEQRLRKKLRLSIDEIKDKSSFTLEEIAKFLGITKERVRQIEEMALQKLKKIMIKEEKAV
jgi:RNA polymerase primary sigma factor